MILPKLVQLSSRFWTDVAIYFTCLSMLFWYMGFFKQNEKWKIKNKFKQWFQKNLYSILQIFLYLFIYIIHIILLFICTHLSLVLIRMNWNLCQNALLNWEDDTHFISKITYQYIVIIMMKIHLKLHSKCDLLRKP